MFEYFYIEGSVHWSLLKISLENKLMNIANGPLWRAITYHIYLLGLLLKNQHSQLFTILLCLLKATIVGTASSVM